MILGIMQSPQWIRGLHKGLPPSSNSIITVAWIIEPAREQSGVNINTAVMIRMKCFNNLLFFYRGGTLVDNEVPFCQFIFEQ